MTLESIVDRRLGFHPAVMDFGGLVWLFIPVAALYPRGVEGGVLLLRRILGLGLGLGFGAGFCGDEGIRGA